MPGRRDTPTSSYYTTKEAAKRLETSIRVVQRWIKAGRLAAELDTSGRWMIPAQAIRTFKRKKDFRHLRKPES